MKKIAKCVLFFVCVFALCSCDFNKATTKSSDVDNVHAQYFELTTVTQSDVSPIKNHNAIKLKNNPGTLPDKLIIPKEINSKAITAIDAQAFSAVHIKTLYIPSTVTYVPSAAFEGCSIDLIQAPAGLAITEPLFTPLNIERY